MKIQMALWGLAIGFLGAGLEGAHLMSGKEESEGFLRLESG